MGYVSQMLVFAATCAPRLEDLHIDFEDGDDVWLPSLSFLSQLKRLEMCGFEFPEGPGQTSNLECLSGLRALQVSISSTSDSLSDPACHA